MDIKIAGKFKISRKLGHGSFGDIYLGQNVRTGEQVAVKLEKIRVRNPKLLSEARILKSIQGGAGIPTLHWFGAEGDFSIMVMEKLGPSLEDLLHYCNYSMSLKSVVQLAEQMLTRIEYLHSKDLIHRDIKPENFLIGLSSNSGQVYLIDFGLAKKFRDPRSGNHISYCEGKSLTGTARYASIFTHRGIQQSRRDDLECLGYVLVYLLKGFLPWQGLDGNTQKEKYDNITQTKLATSLSTLCADLPFEFQNLILMSRSLDFEARPDYAGIRKMFLELAQRTEISFDRVFEWTEGRLDEEQTQELIKLRGRSPNRSIDYGRARSGQRNGEQAHPDLEDWEPKLHLVVVDNN